MGEMFDSAGDNFPAGAGLILLPSDGAYAANNAAVKAKFPNARYQTYSAIGQVPAMWVDVETGCVWPPSAGVAKWRLWRTQGCRGFYCATSTKPDLQALLQPGESPEWFEADPTGTPHVRAGDAETQWGWFGSYDETEIPDPLVVVPPPVPHHQGAKPVFVAHTPTCEYLIFDNGTKAAIHAAATGSNLVGTSGLGLPYIAIDDATAASIRDCTA